MKIMQLNQSTVVGLLFIFGFILRLIILLNGALFLIKNAIVLDDTFIALSIARNIYVGKGYSFNGIELTSGAPPAWPLILSFFNFLGTENIIVFSSLLSSIFFILSGLFLYKILEKFANSKCALFAISFFLFNPFLFLISLNGLETSLFIFLIVITFYFYYKYLSRRDSFKNILIFSLLLALTMYVREEAFLVLCSFSIVFFLAKKFNTLAKILCLVFVFYSPLILWRFLTFGYILSSPSYFLIHTPLLQKYGFLTRRVGVFLLIIYMLNQMLGSLFFSLYGLLRTRKRWFIFSPLLFYICLNILFYSVVVPTPKYRYIAPSASILILFLPPFFEDLLNLLGKKFILPAIFLLIFFYFYFTILPAIFCWTNFGYCPDSEIKASLTSNVALINMSSFIKENLPKECKIATGHIGVIQYFSEHPIIDTGGKVSYDASSAHITHKLKEYLEAKETDYLIIDLKYADLKDVVFIALLIKRKLNNPFDIIFSKETYEAGNIALVKYDEKYIKFL
jgi:hypothetical protein